VTCNNGAATGAVQLFRTTDCSGTVAQSQTLTVGCTSSGSSYTSVTCSVNSTAASTTTPNPSPSPGRTSGAAGAWVGQWAAAAAVGLIAATAVAAAM
jgi:hypothetical protein